MKHFVSLKDYSREQLETLLELGAQLKAQRGYHDKVLEGQTVAMLFTKPSNRTRVSFEVGAKELGAHTICLGPQEVKMGAREMVKDVARVLSRYVHAIVIRTFDHEDVVQLAQWSDVPVINGLTDLFHPCQILADVMTVREHKTHVENPKIVYVGDGNNILNSWLYAAGLLGLNFVYSTPVAYQPQKAIVQEVQNLAQSSGAQIQYFEDPLEAVADADIIYTDVWVSMGQEVKAQERQKLFMSYQVNEALLTKAKSDGSVMHCLPAHRGLEVEEVVLDGPHSIVFDQAENRMHIQKAIMQSLIVS